MSKVQCALEFRSVKKCFFSESVANLPKMDEIKSSKLTEAPHFTSTDPHVCVKLIDTKMPNSDMEPLTIPEVMSRTCENFASMNALMYKKEGSKEWTAITFGEYKQRTEKIARAFIKLGLEEHGTVAVLSATCVEWFLSIWAAIHAGGQIAGIYATNSADACKHILEDSGANILVVDSDLQLKKVLSFRDQLKGLKAIVQIEKSSEERPENVYSWSDIEVMDTNDVDEIYRDRFTRITPNSCCLLVYTSGTTGAPKGVMLSHDNQTFSARAFIDRLACVERGNERIVSFLPLSHIAAILGDAFLSASMATTVYIADKDAIKGSILTTMTEVRPTLFFAVPRVYEKIHEKLAQKLSETSGFKLLLLNWARNVALDYHRSGGRSFQYLLAKRILGKIKSALGLDCAKILMVGAAPMRQETHDFFMSLDMKLLNGYGMTESSTMSLNTYGEFKSGSAGKFLPEIETKIIDGEICTRGRNTFMGYLRNPAKTAEVIDENLWCHTGDVGEIDADGYLFVTGRIKELIVTSGGENVPYLLIEGNVKAECAAISNALLVGDHRKFLTMLITLKTEVDVTTGARCDELASESLKLMNELNLNYTRLSEVLNAGPDPKVMEAIKAAIDRANLKAISNAQRVQKFAILPNDFTLATGELNSTLKIKRFFIHDKYKEIIEGFYAA